MSFVGPSVQNSEDEADPPPVNQRESGLVQHFIWIQTTFRDSKEQQ